MILFKNGRYIVKSSIPLQRGYVIQIVNSNCEFAYDSFFGSFTTNNCLETYEVDLMITKEDLSDYEVEKSNNGGHYAYAIGVVTEVIEIKGD